MSIVAGSPLYWLMTFAALYFIVKFMRNHWNM